MSTKHLFNGLALFAALTASHLAMATTCRDVPEQLVNLFEPGQIVLFGEIHGTLEMPRRFYDAICAAATAGIKVNVGLEMPRQFNAQKNSDEGLYWTETTFFTQDYQDGRASVDMNSLIKAIGRLEYDGKPVSIFLFDHRGAERDRAMADTILEYADRESVTLVLTGNLHSRTAHGAPWDENRGNMGAYIAEQWSETRSILFTYDAGKAWLCNPDCDIKEVGGNAQSDEEFVAASDDQFHQYHWYVGTPTESIPYRMYAEQRGRQ